MEKYEELQNSVIYQVFVRNFTEEGTFNALKTKLEYIKNLKTDILYLLPISPIGEIGRKGDLGSPYAIKDYREINPELGSLNDFKSLIDETHKLGMKIMIDIVFNHTSRDSWILNNHPEWMYKNKEGKFANKAGDWSDVYDLDTTNQELIKYLVDTIDFYSSLGIDGYRFDVASLISKEFFIELKKMLNEKYPDTILLAESIHGGFLKYCRDQNFNALSDNELYEYAFDLLYTYNSIPNLQEYLLTHDPYYLTIYKGQLFVEETNIKKESLRIRCLENHDQIRLIEYPKLNNNILYNLLAFTPFLKGPMFIYNGLETKANHHLNLFTKDLLDLDLDYDWFNKVSKVINFKKDKINQTLLTSIPLYSKGNNIIIENSYLDKSKIYGFFNLDTKDETLIEIPLNENKEYLVEDGLYFDYLSKKEYEIKDHKILVSEPLYLIKK